MDTINAHGMEMPLLGFGTWSITKDVCRNAVAEALKVGYRHIDTAAGYKNEVEVGEAIRASGIDREDIFLTTKIRPEDLADGVMQDAATESIKKLGVKDANLILIHWPSRTIPVEDTIKSLNEVKKMGLTRYIGVSNFNETQLRAAAAVSEAPLTTLQVEYQPYLNQNRMIGVTKELGMAFTAYSPVGRGQILTDPVVNEIAERIGKSPAQVVLRWHFQQGVVAIPRSQTPSRIADNFAITEFELNDADMATIFALANPDGRIVSPEAVAPDWDAQKIRARY